MDVASLTSLPIITPGPTGAASPVQETLAAPPAQADSQTNTSAAPSAEKLAGAVNQINDSFARKGLNLYASFEKDKATGISVVKIVDKKTNETVNQMPIKEILAFAQSLTQQQGVHGKLLNTSA